MAHLHQFGSSVTGFSLSSRCPSSSVSRRQEESSQCLGLGSVLLIPSLSILCFRFTLYSPHIHLLQLVWRIVSRNDMHLSRSHLVMFFKHPPSDMILNLRRYDICTPCISSQLLRDGGQGTLCSIHRSHSACHLRCVLSKEI